MSEWAVDNINKRTDANARENVLREVDVTLKIDDEEVTRRVRAAERVQRQQEEKGAAAKAKLGAHRRKVWGRLSWGSHFR